jgi:hypothetical protein
VIAWTDAILLTLPTGRRPLISNVYRQGDVVNFPQITDYDWQVFLDELARLERAALGEVVYGKSRCEPKT